MDENKTPKLRAIRDALLHATDSPLYSYRVENHYYPVIGEGNHDADLMFIGEAPGENEAKKARPFCGAAGQVLDELLASIFLPRNAVYITNIVKDRPPGNRDPLPREIAYYAPFLDTQITIIQPKVIATLGRFSMQYILEKYDVSEKAMTISALHGRKLSANISYGIVAIVPLYHPAVALYTLSQKQTLFKDFQVLKDVLTH